MHAYDMEFKVKNFIETIFKFVIDKKSEENPDLSYRIDGEMILQYVGENLKMKSVRPDLVLIEQKSSKYLFIVEVKRLQDKIQSQFTKDPDEVLADAVV